jgi:2',3'-cyclic-nucleotide 2'-phosphodiesterase (5'-nucleotidase family)
VPPTVSPRRTRRGSLALALIALVCLVIPGAALAAKPPAPAPVNIQVLNVSDWHGNLDPVGTVGGAWNISARWAADRAAFDGATLTLTAGDDFGASPPLAGFFDEVPAVKAERLMGIQVNTFGNHDFDKGIAHLQAMIDVAGAPTDADHPGAPFRYVAANLKNISANLTGVDPISYFKLGGAKVAVIGIVNEEAPNLVDPGAFGSIVVTNGVAAANKYAAIARKAGANAVLVITHKGVDSVIGGVPSGALVNFTNGLTPGLVDVVFGDHTNISYAGTVNGVVIHENLSFGQQYTKTTMSVRPGKDGRVTAGPTVTQVTPGPAGNLSVDKTSCTGTGATATFCDQAIVDMLVPYRAELAAANDGVIAHTAGIFDRGGNIERTRETPLGDLIADAMRKYGSQLGYMNGGGIRAQLPSCGYAPVDLSLHRSNYAADHVTLNPCSGGYAAGGPYDIVLGDMGAVQTFNNLIITRTVSGRLLWQMLENGVSVVNSTTGIGIKGRFPQISGFKFTFDYSQPTGCTIPTGDPTDPVWAGGCVPSRVTSVSLDDGTPIPYDNTTYSMATLNFINNGGDGYTMLVDGSPIVTRDQDINVLQSWIESLGGELDPADYPADGRITRVCSLCN